MNLVIGCGYVGRRVADLWLQNKREVCALTRSKERAHTLRAAGMQAIVGDVLDPRSLQLPSVQTMLYAVGYDRQSSASQREVYVDGLRNVLAAVPNVERVVYISSTGVYGQANGEWVDEKSPCEPTREGGKACLAAEQLLLESRWGNRSIILRLAGIYGPGRVPAARDAAARLSLNPGGYLNLIHVDDAVNTVLAAERCGEVPAILVVSDGHPVPRAEYYRHVLELFGSEEAEQTQPTANQGQRRAMGSKRVRNSRMLRQLQVRPQYPSYQEGLAAIAAGC